MDLRKLERCLGYKFCQVLTHTALYATLLFTGLLIGCLLPDGNSPADRSVFDIFKVDGSLGGAADDRGIRDQTTSHLNVRVLCYVVTSPTFLWTRAVHVQNTWGRRCDKTLYFSSETNATFPAIGLNVSEGREHLTAKSHLAFRYIYKNYFNDFDWFLKADDNTYVVVENLQYFLSHKNTRVPTFYGHHFLSIIEGGYASGGAGYVLSKEALRRLAERGSDPILCRQDGGSEDVEIGKCLHNLGAIIGDSYDPEGKSLFHCFDPASHLLGDFPSWYRHYDAGGALKGKNTMGRELISFHYVKPADMYIYDYFLYHVTVRGLT